MFSKDKKPDAVPTPAPAPAAPLDRSKLALKPHAVPSIISADMTIKGDLASAGDLQVEGHVIGDIHVAKLTIAEGGHVTGDIVARDVRICGMLKGSVRAAGIILTNTARVTGDLHHELLTIETGGQLEGLSRRLIHEPEVTTHEPVLELTSEHEVSGDHS
jgi:cytoskeletal protein CcmA (bactofilin family)